MAEGGSVDAENMAPSRQNMVVVATLHPDDAVHRQCLELSKGNLLIALSKPEGYLSRNWRLLRDIPDLPLFSCPLSTSFMADRDIDTRGFLASSFSRVSDAILIPKWTAHRL
jgi:hypothetical protein